MDNCLIIITPFTLVSNQGISCTMSIGAQEFTPGFYPEHPNQNQLSKVCFQIDPNIYVIQQTVGPMR